MNAEEAMIYTKSVFANNEAMLTALQECANKLQSDKDAMFIENQSLLHKFRKAGDVNRFLQKERNKWFDAYNQVVETNEKATVEQADEMRQLKAENERLRAYVIEKDGIEIFDEVQPAPTLQELEKADEAIQPVILLSIKDVGYFRFRTPADPPHSRPIGSNIKEAIKFDSMNEVQNYLGEFPTGDIITTYHHPKTLELMPNPKEQTPF